MQTNGRAFPRNSSVLLWIGEILRLGLRFAVLALLARVVPVDVLGVYLSVTTIALIAPRLLDFGLPHSLGYFLRLEPRSLRAGNRMLFRHVVYVAPLTLAVAFGIRYVPFASSTTVLVAQANWIHIGLLILSELAISLGLGAFIPTSRFAAYLVTVVTPPSLFLGAIGLVPRTYLTASGLLHLLLATSFAGSAVMAINLARAARQQCDARFPVAAAYSYGIRSYGSAVSKLISQRFDRLFLVAALGPAGYAQYSLAISIRDIAVLPANLHAITMRNDQIDLLVHHGNLDAARHMLIRVSLAWFALGIGGAVLMYPFWPSIVQFVFGARFQASASFLKIVAFSGAPIATMGFAWNHLYSMKRPGRVTMITVAALLFAIPIFFLSIHLYGPAIGAAIAAVGWSAVTAAVSFATAMMSESTASAAAEGPKGSFVPAYLGPRYRRAAAPPILLPTQEVIRRQLVMDCRDEDWEAVDCLCGASGGRVLTEVDRYGLPYRNVLCADCGLIRATPRWKAERYARFYENQYRDLYSEVGIDRLEDSLQRLSQGVSARSVADFVTRAWRVFGDPRIERPVIVEVGAGGGWNLSGLPEHWIRIGYDSDERFLELGRTIFGIEMRRGFLAEALSEVGEAHCILLSHVLEHVPDPVATLKDLGASASTDALILVEVPGIFRLHKTSLNPMKYWQNAHTFTFCAKTALATCRRAGLEPLAIDELVRVILRKSNKYYGPVSHDGMLAPSIDRYLRYCELSYRTAETCAAFPLLGPTISGGVRRTADGLARLAAVIGLINGMRATR